jgi:voltage-gated potassium channel
VSRYRDERLERVERFTKPTELLLSVLLVGVLVAPFVVEMSPSSVASLDQFAWFLWGLFCADYLFRLLIARYKPQFLRRNVLDLAVVVLPLLTPLLPAAQLFQAMRAVRIVVLLFDISKEMQSVLRSRNLPYAVAIVLLLIFVCGALEYGFEHRNKAATIHNLGDGLWWAITTFTTVGYGDTYPVTAAGRGVAILLMVVSLAFGGVLAAGLVSLFIRNDKVDEDLNGRIVALETKIDRMLDLLDAGEATRTRENLPATQTEGETT